VKHVEDKKWRLSLASNLGSPSGEQRTVETADPKEKKLPTKP
jgi:hypothetical protein